MFMGWNFKKIKMENKFNPLFPSNELEIFKMGESYTLDAEYVKREAITTEWNRRMEKLLKRVLQQYLQREVTIDDFKRIKKKMHNFDNYSLFYENVELGTVHTIYDPIDDLNRKYEVSVRFIPKKI